MDGPPVEACCDASEVLELVEASFDGVADFVGFEVVGDWLLAGRIAGDDGFGAHAGDQATQGVGIIGFVGKNTARGEPFEQGRGERRIAALSGCEDQLQRPASTAMWILVVSPPLERPRACSPLFGRHPFR